MRIMHISDLHLGKIVNDINMIEDQRYVLNQVIDFIDNNIDVLIIAGDIYDKSNPSIEAMNLFNDFIIEISKKNITSFIISGNHDSSVRLEYLSSFLKVSNIFISKPFNKEMDKFTLEDENGVIHFYLLPYFKLSQAKNIFQIDFKNYDEAMLKIIDNANININERNVLIAHQFVSGATTSDSEEIIIGGLDGISYEVFNDFDYVALGHLHKPQKIGKETIRYCGTLLKYSFSEVNHEKSITILDFKEKGNITIEKKKVQFLKDMKEYKGSYDLLYSFPYSEDYVRIILTDEEIMPDSRINLLSVFPNMMKFAIENSKTNIDFSIKELENLEKMSPIDLFIEFYKMQNNGVKPNENQVKIIETLISEGSL
ncbi:MAG: exonuclease SbcCD subunit D [Erysipelotrichaceae bacterium]|nr:exonuclease SbcCD subunit D [Erysipelotrichaceae bacterium]